MKKMVIIGAIVAVAGFIAAAIVYFHRLGETIDMFLTDMENLGYD